MSHNLSAVNEAVRAQWLLTPGATNAELSAAICDLFPAELQREGGKAALHRDVKVARTRIPFSRAEGSQ
eukprot:1880802-Rhodomonas_salina.1